MAEYSGVLPLYEPAGYQLRQSEAGRAYYEADQPRGGPSLSGKVPSYQTGTSKLSGDSESEPVQGAAGMAGSQRPAPAEVAHRALNPEELMALAQQMQDEIAAQSDALDRQPTSVEATRQRDEGAPYWLRSYMGER